MAAICEKIQAKEEERTWFIFSTSVPNIGKKDRALEARESLCPDMTRRFREGK